MKKISYLLLLFVTTISFSQVGIGTTSPDASSVLDISATDAGFLVPRMTLVQRNSIATPIQEGLLIFQTDNTPGFYYYDGSGWNIIGGATAGTSLTLDEYKNLTDAVKVSNTATTNVNTTGETVYSDFTTTDLLELNRNQFTFASNGITPNFNGFVEIIFNIKLDFNSGANGPRVSPGFRWKHNGSVGPWAVHSYIRSASDGSGTGPYDSSVNFSTIIEVVSGSPIQIEHKKFSGSGNVSSPASGVEFIVKRRL